MVQTPHWKSLDPLTRWLQGLLIAGVLLSILAVVSGMLEVQLIERAATSGITDAEAASNDSRQQFVGVLQLGIYLATIVVFLMWFHQAHRNLPALGNTNLKYSPRWAVGGFFVPFLNLVRPLQVMQEIWHGSKPRPDESDPAHSGNGDAESTGTPALVGLWWILFLVTGLLGRIIFRDAFNEAATIEEIKASSQLMVVADGIDVPTTILFLIVISRIGSWQKERHRIAQESISVAHGPAISQT